MTLNLDILKTEANSPMEKAEQVIQLEAIKRGIDKKLKEYKAELLAATQEMDVLTLKTGKYTISRARRITPKVVDFETLKETLENQNIPYDTKEVFADHMRSVFAEAVKQGRELEGLESQTTEYISIRINKK